MPFKCPGGDVVEVLELYLKSKGMRARSINLGLISIRCVLHLQDWISVMRLRTEEGSSPPEQSQVRTEPWKAKDGVTNCVMLLGGHVRRLTLGDCLWQHTSCDLVD